MIFGWTSGCMGPEHPGLWNATPGCRRSQDVGVCKHLCFCLL